MAIEYYSINGKNTLSKRSYAVLEGGVQIGSVEAYINQDGVLISAVNIFPEFQGAGKGYEVFESVFNEINNIQIVQIIRGVWCVSEEYNHCENGMSTNLNEFQKLRQTKSDEESVFLTPTGKWAIKLGFNNANIISISNNEVIVDYFRKSFSN